MQLAHIALDHLSISPANMRASKKLPEISDILPSVRARGVLVPLLVRANGSPDTYEIVAGRRRFFAAKAVADEGGSGDPLPCAVMEPGDDAAALEASLIENVARLDAHEVEQWETFTRLVTKEGRRPEHIAATFGMEEVQVRRTLALGNLLPKIREAYARDEIDPASVRHLTMASKAQQKEWLALLNDKDAYAPTGHSLKQWLFGGQPIATGVALFDLASFTGQIVADLFGDAGYFADANAFWEAQRAAVEARRLAYLEAGWSEVVILGPHDYFQSWEHEKTAKSKGGKVYIAISHRGEVALHEGYVSRREAEKARRAARGESEVELIKPARPEVSSSMQTYVDLHRHAAVRATLTDHHGAALRLMVAHVIAGSHLFRVQAEPQRSGNDMIAESIENAPAEAAFDAKRRAVLAMLDFDPDAATVVGRFGDGYATAELFAKLLTLTEAQILDVIAVAMGESLEAGSMVVEAVGLHLGVDIAALWQPDAAFFELIRDKAIVNALLADIGGEAVASANAGEKVKAQKQLVRDFIDGTNGRPQRAWLPRWMAFPPAAYTDRGGFRTVSHALQVAPLFEAATLPEEVQEVAAVIEAEADPAGEDAHEETLAAA
ncbi:ParB/RepB/Spo0J family partition protein [Sphingomonas sp. RB1R13]|uniref:ParB/RepB/Spo0J family partition protein n=1 Tax=Sphingomonas sp. RB1R13 TaxID=3096159 RepID=UPI002FC59885